MARAPFEDSHSISREVGAGRSRFPGDTGDVRKRATAGRQMTAESEHAKCRALNALTSDGTVTLLPLSWEAMK